MALVNAEELIKEPQKFKELKENGIMIDPKKIEDYIENFKKQKSAEPNPEYWKGKTVLITGINGFVGSHLAEDLLKNGAIVHGIVRRHSVPSYPNLKKIEDKVILHQGDLLSDSRIKEIVTSINPKVIFHLASESFVQTSFKEPRRISDVNVGGTINLLEACRELKGLEAIHFAGSSEQYGLVISSNENYQELLKKGNVYPPFKGECEVPIKEDNPFRPMSPYGTSKVSMELNSLNYHRMYGIPVIITRAFNHEGPRRGHNFVTTVINKQLARIKKGMSKEIIIGNPTAIRDFTHVKDTVRGYMLAVEKCKKAEPYNMCSGRCITIYDYIKLGLEIFNLKADIKIDSERFRPSEVPILLGDNSKFCNETGWQPTKTIVDIIKDGTQYLLDNPEQLKIESN